MMYSILYAQFAGICTTGFSGDLSFNKTVVSRSTNGASNQVVIDLASTYNKHFTIVFVTGISAINKTIFKGEIDNTSAITFQYKNSNFSSYQAIELKSVWHLINAQVPFVAYRGLHKRSIKFHEVNRDTEDNIIQIRSNININNSGFYDISINSDGQEEFVTSVKSIMDELNSLQNSKN